MTREELEKAMGNEPKIQASFEVIGDYIKFNVNGKEKIFSFDELEEHFSVVEPGTVFNDEILTEAIARYTSNAEYERTHGNLQGCLEFRQLAEWLKELKKYKAEKGVRI